jgi:hypothetical protein
MLSKITSALKSGQFWAGFVVGAIAATASSKLRSVVAPVAAKIPGAN